MQVLLKAEAGQAQGAPQGNGVRRDSGMHKNVMTVAQYRQMAEFFDLTFKLQTLLNSLTEIFRVTSTIEALMFFVAIVFFCFGPDGSTWYGVLALFHVARALVGFGMGRVVPSSYDFVEKIEFRGDKQYASLLQLRTELEFKVKSLLADYYDDFEKLARLYSLLAIVSFTVDVVSFFAVFGLLTAYIGDGDDAKDVLGTAWNEDIYLTAANPYLARILVILVYSICDIVYLLWLLHFRSRVGENERVYVLKALLGFGDSMRIAFGFAPKAKKPGKRKQTADNLQKNKNGARSRARD